ncbi:MAG TPA: carboxylesterase family protein [Candidatus Dormibacteraeota bacterium]|nr:carboxylesterase family protein [Candidatus Dormibacteraeota bacterium]
MSIAAGNVVVTTRHGQVRGQVTDGVAGFKGIPYAAPPFGPNRFQPPRPPQSWDGVRDALEYGRVPPQPPYAPPFDRLLGDQGSPGEDCLNLNLWTPDASRGGLPVMVWIPGGAFVRGSGAIPTYDGGRFARDGVVCVTINYRLGADGFLYLGDGIANRGLLDQIAALEWVQENIRAFGGDPSRVTIFGESAGAFSVATLLTMPRAKGLFQRAIAQSGAGHHTSSLATAQLVGRNLADKLGVAPTMESIAAVPLARLVDAEAELGQELAVRPDPARWGEVAANGMIFEPVVDGNVLPARPIEAIVAGASADLDVMVGTTTEEWRFFLVPGGAIDRVTEERVLTTARVMGLDVERALAVYRTARPQATPGDLLAALITDWFFRIPAIRLAEARAKNGGSSHMYEFAWRSPLFDGRFGAAHALEIGFVFDNLGLPGAMTLAGSEPPQTLADVMHRAWVEFATSGAPGWSPYDVDERTVMRFDGAGGTAVVDPAADVRPLWDGIR